MPASASLPFPVSKGKLEVEEEKAEPFDLGASQRD